MSITLAIILSSIFLGYFYNKIVKKNEEDLIEMKRRIEKEFDQKLEEELSRIEFSRRAREQNEKEELIRKERRRQFRELNNKDAYYESDEIIWERMNQTISFR